jgi:nucleoid-associated protein YgaU
MSKLTLLILLLSVMVSCSGPKSSDDLSEEPAGLEFSEEEDLFADDDFDQTLDEEISDDMNSKEVANVEGQAIEDVEEKEAMVAENDSAIKNDTDDLLDEMEDEKEDPKMVEKKENSNGFFGGLFGGDDKNSKVEIQEVGEARTYTVEKNDTLMLIAFKIYGDYGKWREILKANKKTLKGNYKRLKKGMTLTYYSDGDMFEWNPGGIPYPIKWGDTLGIISNKVYGTPKKWRGIWRHNKPMIKDPNKIYAGFTLYYLEDGREVASP